MHLIKQDGIRFIFNKKKKLAKYKKEIKLLSLSK